MIPRNLLVRTGLFMAGILMPISAPAAELKAVQMTPANVAELQHGGPDTWGGIGDWHLSNGTLCAIISDVDHESDLSAKGGVLIDLGLCGREDDQWVSAQDLIGGSRKTPMEYDNIIATSGEDSASIYAFGGSGGLVIETRYTVNLEQPQRLFISKRLYRRGKDSKTFGVYTPITFNYHSMETFLFSSVDPSKSNGFQQEEFSRRGPAAFGTAARDVDTIVMLGPHDSVVPISYGWRLKSVDRLKKGKIEPMPRFALADWGAAAFLLVTDDFLLGRSNKLGLLQLLQVAMMELETGQEIHIEEEILVGERGDVAAITDQFFPEAPLVTGSAPGEGVVIHVERSDGAPFTQYRPSLDGKFSFRAPPGVYALRAVAPGGMEVTQGFEVTEAGAELSPIDLGEPARVTLPRGEAMRLVFKGMDGTPDPDFENPLTGFSVTDDEGVYTHTKVPAVFLAGVESDRESVAIEPGTYRVYATRGIEYSLETAEIMVGEGETVALEIETPKRVVETPGYIAADLHVHSGPSMDNSFSTRERVRTFVAEHGEVLVASEHETLYDFAPLVAEMGVTDKIVTINGTEMTSEVPHVRTPYTTGHANFFPMALRPHLFRKGVPMNEGRRMREVLDAVSSDFPNLVSQLNHARDSLRLSGQVGGDYHEHINYQAYLDHMGPAAHPYDPSKPLTSDPNNTLIEPDPVTGTRDLDFDAIEIMNGDHEHAPDRIEALRRDWTSFLLQGERLTGTANSDSHGKRQQVALPRNMVAVEDDRIEAFDVDAFCAAIKAGNLYGTTGPLLEVTLSGTPMGGMHTGGTGSLEVRVKTATWIDARTLRVVVDGETLHEGPVPEDGRFMTELSFEADALVLVDVEGEAGDGYRAVYPGFIPYAFSNPIYIDADGDGVWTAPGL